MNFIGCHRPDGNKQGPDPDPTSGSSASSAAQTPSGAPASNIAPAYRRHSVPEGSVTKAAPWTKAYDIVGAAAEGVSYEVAQERCNADGRWMCTDTQWQRACAADAALGKIETWTSTGVGNQRFVVRGGGSCESRQVAPATQAVPTRAGLCCDPVVAIDTKNRNLAFLRASAARLEEYAEALRGRSAERMRPVYADRVAFLGKEYSQDQMVDLYRTDFARFPKQWTLFDGCTVNVEAQGPDSILISYCRTVYKRGGNVLVGLQKIVRGGPEAKIQQIGATSLAKLSGKSALFMGYQGETEHTEKVEGLLLSD